MHFSEKNLETIKHALERALSDIHNEEGHHTPAGADYVAYLEGERQEIKQLLKRFDKP